MFIRFVGNPSAARAEWLRQRMARSWCGDGAWPQVGDGDASRKVFKIDDSVLQPEQLLAAIFQIVHRVSGLLLGGIFFASGGNIQRNPMQ